MLHTITVMYVVSKSKMMKCPQQEVTGDAFETHDRGLKLAYWYSADLGRHFNKESNRLLTLKETPARAKHGSGLFFTTVFIMKMNREKCYYEVLSSLWFSENVSGHSSGHSPSRAHLTVRINPISISSDLALYEIGKPCSSFHLSLHRILTVSP